MADSNLTVPAFQAKAAALTAEYNTLRTEQIELVKGQSQMYNYTLIVIGAAITGLITVLVKSNLSAIDIYVFLFWILLFTPYVIGQIGLLFFDQEFMIHANGSHIHNYLRAEFNKLMSSQSRLMKLDHEEPPYFKGVWDLNYLHYSTGIIHDRLYKARWNFFFYLTLAPIILLPIHIVIGLFEGYLVWINHINLTTVIINLICIVLWTYQFKVYSSLQNIKHWLGFKNKQPLIEVRSYIGDRQNISERINLFRKKQKWKKRFYFKALDESDYKTIYEELCSSKETKQAEKN